MRIEKWVYDCANMFGVLYKIQVEFYIWFTCTLHYFKIQYIHGVKVVVRN